MATQAGLPGAKTMPHGLTRLASDDMAPTPAESETSLVTEYPLAAFTVSVAEAIVLPLAASAPVQVSVYVSLPAAVGVTAWLPAVA